MARRPLPTNAYKEAIMSTTESTKRIRATCMAVEAAVPAAHGPLGVLRDGVLGDSLATAHGFLLGVVQALVAARVIDGEDYWDLQDTIDALLPA